MTTRTDVQHTRADIVRRFTSVDRLADRFWAKVNFDGPVPAHRSDLGPCWIWKTGTDSNGYGKVWFQGNDRPAHRVAYELIVGTIPDGLTLDHLCRVLRCVRPAHLEPVSLRENILRGEGPAALNARKTACVNGHLFSAANSYQRSRLEGGRDCRLCQRVRHQRWLARKAVKEAGLLEG